MERFVRPVESAFEYSPRLIAEVRRVRERWQNHVDAIERKIGNRDFSYDPREFDALKAKLRGDRGPGKVARRGIYRRFGLLPRGMLGRAFKDIR